MVKMGANKINLYQQISDLKLIYYNYLDLTYLCKKIDQSLEYHFKELKPVDSLNIILQSQNSTAVKMKDYDINEKWWCIGMNISNFFIFYSNI